MKRIDKRDKLIQVGKQIVVQQGFNAASLNEILKAASVPKGSFYYYFDSKEDFGLAIIEYFADSYRQKLQRILKDESIAPLTRLRNYFELGIAEMESSQCSDGCLFGNLAQELSAQNELFRDRLKQVFLDWEGFFAECLQAAFRAEEIDSQDIPALAQFVLSGWEGAILQAKVTKSTIPMENFIRVLFERVLSRS